jgi:ResB-like family protein
VELKDKANGRSLGTHLYSMWLNPKKIEHEGKTYEIALRARRDYRPYFVRLNKANEEEHPNVHLAKDYSSWVQLIVPDQKIDREEHIYMNTPLRYAGETFFQANMSHDPVTGIYTTGLQVVRNPGWRLPYLSCFFVALGMLIHFGIHLVGFVTRRVA